VTVELEADGSRHQGQAEGAVDTTARARVVGEATLRALESVIGTGKFELAAVGTSTSTRSPSPWSRSTRPAPPMPTWARP
jgi:hypothetical protein